MKNLNDIFDKVGATIGWDFSQIRCVAEGEAWDFYRTVASKFKTSDFWLDIGIGGGEKVLEIASLVHLLVGIDASAAMLETAHRNLQRKGLTNVRFLPMDASVLAFPDNFFDIVTARHCLFNPKEVLRVLKPGRWFLTQQVEPGDKENLENAFGRGQFVGETDSLWETYTKALKDAGFSKVDSDLYNAIEYYERPEDLIFLLQNTPIIPEFGQIPGDWETLDRFIHTHRTELGIRTNSKRSLIIAEK